MNRRIGALFLWACAWMSCAGPDAEDGSADETPPPGDADADTDTDADSDADTDADGPPTRLTASCAPTENALRYGCTVTVEPPQAVQLTWVRDDGLGPQRVRTSDGAQAEHPIDVLWLAGGRPYTLVATATAWPDAAVAVVALTPEPPPGQVASFLEVSGTSSLGLIGTEAPCNQRAFAVIYDTGTGDLVWFEDLDPSGNLGMLDMVRFTDRQTVIGETDGHVVEVDLMGNDIVRFPVDYGGCCGLNHDIFERDGIFYSQYQHISNGLTLDNVVALDATGTELWTWDPADHLPIPDNSFGDYLHTNSEYIDADGNLYVSWLNRDAVGKFVGDPNDPRWGERIWVMTGDGRNGELGNDITLDWSAVGGDDEFGGQHNFHVRHDGRLMLLDNSGGRGLVITVDEATMTGTVDAEYETAEGFCGPQGTAMDSSVGNAIVACQSDTVREYDLGTGNQVWEAEIACQNDGGGGFSDNAAVRWYPLDTWE